MSGTEVVQRTPQQELVATIRSPTFMEQVRLALPGNVTPDRFQRATVTAVLQNPDIVQCQPDSIIQSVIKCAQDGLLPDGREAALVKFGNKATYMSMIGGLRKIAAEHGWSLRTQVVYDNDDFDYTLGLSPDLKHRPVRIGGERGPMVAAYAVATHKDGRQELEVLTAEDIEKVRRVSRAKDSGPWKDWPERMWEKTAGRRLFAKLPLGEREQERIARVIEASYEPGDAAKALYGEVVRRPPVVGELPPATPVAEPADGAADADASGDGADQQAAAGAEPAAAPGPDDDPEPGPAPDPGEQASFQIPDQAVDEAGAFTISTGAWKGYTVASIAEAGDNGLKYLRWVLRHEDRARADVYAAVTTYARGRMPELLTEGARQ